MVVHQLDRGVMSGEPTRQVDALVRVGRVLSSTADYEQALAALITTISDLLDVETAGFMLYDDEHEELRLQQPAFGIDDPAVIAAYRVSLREGGNAVRVFLSHEPYIAREAPDDPRLISRYVELFAARSVMTVPLVVEGEAIGVCHAINKRTGTFTDAALDLFTLIAPLLAVSVQSADMFRQLRGQRRQLERAIHLQRELSRTAFDAPGMGSLTQRLSDLVGRGVMVVDPDLRPLASWAWPQGMVPDRSWLAGSTRFGLLDDDAAPDRPALAPVAVGRNFGGWLAVATNEDDGALDEVDVRAIEHAASIFALEMLRERTSWEVESRIKGDLIQHLTSGSLTGRDEARRLLTELGSTTDGPWRVVTLVPQWRRASSGSTVDRDEVHGPTARVYPAMVELCRELWGLASLAPWRDGYLVVLPASTDDPQVDITLVDDLLARGQAITDDHRPGSTMRAAASSPVRVASELGNALQEADSAARVAQALGVTDRPLVFEHLGVYRVLLGGSGPQERAAFVDEALGALQTHDEAQDSELLATLRAYVRADFVAAAAARHLFVHPNTLAYRLKAIRRLLGGDPSEGDLRLQVELALKLQDLSALAGVPS